MSTLVITRQHWRPPCLLAGTLEQGGAPVRPASMLRRDAAIVSREQVTDARHAPRRRNMYLHKRLSPDQTMCQTSSVDRRVHRLPGDRADRLPLRRPSPRRTPPAGAWPPGRTVRRACFDQGRAADRAASIRRWKTARYIPDASNADGRKSPSAQNISFEPRHDDTCRPQPSACYGQGQLELTESRAQNSL